MADDVIDRMYVEILPQLEKFNANLRRDLNALNRQVERQFKTTAQVAEKQGNETGKKYSAGFKNGMKAVAAGTAIGLAAIAGLGAQAFKTFGDFDKTIRQFGAITGDAGRSLENMSDLALKMGKDTSFSAGQAADAMLELAKGGLTSAQIRAGGLQATLTLAAAGGLELADAATTMANTLNTFGLGAKDANAVAAALAGAANASTASVSSLAQALSQVGPGAKQAGLSMNETVAALAAFESAGVKGSDAGTSLKTMLQRLVPDTDKAKGTMEDLNLVFTNADGSFKSLAEIAQNLQTSLQGLSASQRTAALNTIFGSDASRAAGILADQGAAGINKMTKATMDLGAAQKLARTNTEGAAGSLEQLGGSIETALIVAGKAIAPFVTTVIKRLTEIVNWLIDRIPGAFESLKGFFAGVISTISDAIDTAGRVLQNLRTLFAPLEPIVRALAIAVGVVLYGAYIAVTTAIKAFLSSIEPATAFLAEHRVVIQAVVVVLGTFVAVVGSVTAAQKAATLATTIWTAAQKAATIASFNFNVAMKVLNATIRANPILFIVGLIAALVAGLIFAYKNSETFRKIVDGALRAVANAGKFMWENVLKPAFEGLKVGVKAVGDAAVWLYENAILPAFNGIKTAVSAVGAAASWLWNTIIKPVFNFIGQAAKVLFAIWAIVVFGPIVLIVKTVGNAVMSLWTNAIKPAFTFIGKLALWLWNNVFKPVGAFIIGVLRAVGAVVLWLWRNVIVPAFNGIRTVISFAWTNVIRPVISSLQAALRAVGGVFTWLWKTIIVPAWNGIKSIIKAVWNGTINPIFSSLKTAARLVGDAFSVLRQTAETAWGQIRDAAKTPIRFVIETIINRGIIGTFNSIAKAVGLSLRLNPVPLPKGFAHGGVVGGPDLGRDSQMIAVRGREAIMVPKFADWVGGERGVARLNRMAERGQLNALQGFAKGGVVRPVEGGRISQGYSSRHPGVDFAVPMGTNIRSALGGVVSLVRSLTVSYGKHVRVDHGGGLGTLYAHMSRIVASLGQRVNAGSSLGRVGSTGNSTGPHLHFEVRDNDGRMNPLTFLAGQTGASGGGGFLGFLEDAWKNISNVGDWIKDKAQAAADFIGDAPGLLRKFLGNAVNDRIGNLGKTGFLADIAKQFPKFVVDKIAGFGKTLASKISFSGAGTTGGNGSQAAQRIAQGMLGQFGWGGGQWAPLRELWTGESNWRWNATNPSSGAYGIPQSLPASKMRSAGADWRTNPATQIRWGMGYIKGRYGTPRGAYSAWLGRSPHWYAGGGALTEPIAGLGLRTGRTYGFAERGTEHIRPGPGNGGGDIYQFIFPNYVGDKNDLVRTLVDLKRQGRLRQIVPSS